MSVSGSTGAKFWGKNFFDTAEDGRARQDQGRQARDRALRAARGRGRALAKVAGEPLWEEWVKKMEAKGHKEARAILNDTLEMLKK